MSNGGTKKGRPRKLEEDSLHDYWNRKARERKEQMKSDIDRIVDAFNKYGSGVRK